MPAKGLGRAFAIGLVGQGAAVIIAERNVSAGEAVAAEIIAAGGAVQAIETDVADSASVNAMVEAVKSAHGRIDILVNNAALLSALPRARIEEISDEVWANVMQINVAGCFNCARAVVPVMKAAEWPDHQLIVGHGYSSAQWRAFQPLYYLQGRDYWLHEKSSPRTWPRRHHGERHPARGDRT